ncbi:MmyB family transcriptional regulator [Streptomyces sp. KR80]|uniref:MmyB family transcriptional regulator n=1 Tax=Streptomyces sp. KR80 TaxID=3457426 RepID=UPI003FD19A1B
MPGGIERKRLLQRMLVDRRAKVDPTDVGLPKPTGRGRRAEGLSQDQVDRLLDRPSGTYARFERGLIPEPPEEYMRAVAELLQFTEDDWRALWAYAREETPPHPLGRPDQGVLDSWQDMLDEVPFMAYITDVAWNLLCHNAAFADMFVSGKAPDNTMEYMLSEEGRQTLADWETAWAPAFLPQLRAAAAAYPYDRTLQYLVEMVLNDPIAGPIFSGDFRSRSHPDGDTRPFHHPRCGKGVVKMNACFVAGIAGARLIFVRFVPERETGSGSAAPTPLTPLSGG